MVPKKVYTSGKVEGRPEGSLERRDSQFEGKRRVKEQNNKQNKNKKKES